MTFKKIKTRFRDFKSIMQATHGFSKQSLKWGVRNRFPTIDRLGQRFTIFKSVSNGRNLVQPLRYLFLGTHSNRSGFLKSNYGVWIADRPKDLTFVHCRDANYLNGLNQLIQSINVDSVFIDIGANIGIFSLIADKNKYIRGVYSFEPSGSSFDFLRTNVERNQATKIKLYPYAIGPITQVVGLRIFEGHSGRSSIADTQDIAVETVKMINHEDLNVIFAGIESAAFVKIDVEGFELQVLEALQKTSVFERVEHMHIEFDVAAGHPEGVMSLLKQADFVEVKRWGDEGHWDSYWTRRGIKPLRYTR